MKFTLTIESSNAAVVGEGAAEVVADMVAYAASQVRDGFTSGYLRDGSNGPSIGYWEYTPEQEYPAIPEITAERLAGLRAALDAEEISYGELAEIDAAFEQIDPATLSDHPENATAEDKLDELEARIPGDEDAKAHANCTAERCDFCDHIRRNCLCGDYCPYNRKGL